MLDVTPLVIKLWSILVWVLDNCLNNTSAVLVNQLLFYFLYSLKANLTYEQGSACLQNRTSRHSHHIMFVIMAIGYDPLDKYTRQCFKGNHIFKKSKWYWNKRRLFLIIFSWTVCCFVRHTAHVVICFLCRRKKKVYIKPPTPVPSWWMNEWMNKRMNEWMNECMNECMSEWINEWICDLNIIPLTHQAGAAVSWVTRLAFFCACGYISYNWCPVGFGIICFSGE